MDEPTKTHEDELLNKLLPRPIEEGGSFSEFKALSINNEALWAACAKDLLHCLTDSDGFDCLIEELWESLVPIRQKSYGDCTKFAEVVLNEMLQQLFQVHFKPVNYYEFVGES